MDKTMENRIDAAGQTRTAAESKLLVETAAAAGEIMLVSGAEIFRVEDTVERILKLSGTMEAENVALGTSLFVRLDTPEGETITVLKRIRDRSSNLNRVCQVNEVSRRLCSGEISLEEANRQLERIRKEIQYPFWMKGMGYIGVSAFFALLLGGTWLEGAVAGIAGFFLALVCFISSKVRLNDFCVNALGAFTVGIAALVMQMWAAPGMDRDMVITGAIMPLVPGVVFTTAIRDILNGDYASGTSRMMEAIVIALAVAVGMGAAMALFGSVRGGVPI